jgi:hypothetical protein
MEKAIKIALSYLQTYSKLPLMVVAEDGKGQPNAWLGNFRKKHEKEDQKTFCGVLRVAFQIKNVSRYTLLINADMKLEDGGAPENVLIATEITRNTRRAKIFKVVDFETLKEVMEIETGDNVGGLLEGMYLELLPLRRKDFSEELKTKVEIYLKTITYTPPKNVNTIGIEPQEDGLEALFNKFHDQNQ